MDLGIGMWLLKIDAAAYVIDCTYTLFVHLHARAHGRTHGRTHARLRLHHKNNTDGVAQLRVL